MRRGVRLARFGLLINGVLALVKRAIPDGVPAVRDVLAHTEPFEP